MDIVGIISLGINAIGILVGAVLWLTRIRQQSAQADATHGERLVAQGREIGEVKKRLDAIETDQHLVVRLEERITALTAQMAQQHQIIGTAVQQGIQGALAAVLAGARKAA